MPGIVGKKTGKLAEARQRVSKNIARPEKKNGILGSGRALSRRAKKRNLGSGLKKVLGRPGKRKRSPPIESIGLRGGYDKVGNVDRFARGRPSAGLQEGGDTCKETKDILRHTAKGQRKGQG